MQVKDAMNKYVRTIRPDISVRKASKIMNKHRIGSLVVVSGSGSIEGILTERDILIGVVAENKSSDDVNVGEIMTKKEKLVSVSPTDGLEETAEVMTKNKIKKLPVVKDGKLVGIITASDLITYEKQLIKRVSELLIASKGSRGLAG